RVLRKARVCEIDGAVVIEHYIFEDRTEPQRLENVRLAFRGEIDGLGITATLDVEDAVITPAVLVVADQVAFRICRECGLAGAAESEKQRRSPCPGVCRGRAMHREDAAPRCKIIGYREHSLFHFSGIFSS